MLKKLLGQTASYGLSSIVGRFLNYLLTPLYTGLFLPSEYSLQAEAYAVIGFLAVLLTYGLETAFFNFTKKYEDSAASFTAAFTFIGVVNTSLAVLGWMNADTIAQAWGITTNTVFIQWMIAVIWLDSLSAIPLALLRQQNKAGRFVGINLANIGVNIGANLLFFLVIYPMAKTGSNTEWWNNWFLWSYGIGYVFLANMLASLVRVSLLLPTIIKVKFRLDYSILKEMLRYGWPLMLAGLGGMVNETFDRSIYRIIQEPLVGEEAATTQLGIYSGVYKLSILITMFIQAYRYAVEPFFFAQSKERNAPSTYAYVTTWFTIVVSVIFLGVMANIDWLKYFLQNEAYWAGLDILPILLFANIFLGLSYNLSAWYKLSDKTKYGMYITFIGALITVGLNLWLIPVIGYRGSAWATFASYLAMVLVSYYWGQKHYPIPYELKRIIGYLALAIGLWQLTVWVNLSTEWARIVLGNGTVLLFLAVVYNLEKNRWKTQNQI